MRPPMVGTNGGLLLKRAIIILFLCLVFTASARAATVLVVETETFASGSTGGTATVTIEGDRIRIDSNEGGTDFTIIYGEHEGRTSYLLINNKDRTYYEIDRETMLETRKKLEKQIEVQRRQLEMVPPSQRAQMEKNLRQNMERWGFVDKHVNYSIVSEGVKVRDWSCTQYAGLREGVKVEEVWAADPAKMGLRRSDLDALGAMSDYFEGTGQDLPAFFSFAREGDNDDSTFKGFPAIVVTYRDGKPIEKSQVQSIEREKPAAGFFDLPEGLTKQTLDR